MPLTSTPILVASLATLLVAGQAQGQAAVRLSAGATLWPALVKDDLGGPITLKPGVAPTVTVAVSHPIGLGYRLVLEGSFGTSKLNLTDNGVADQLGSLRTLSAVLLLDGPIKTTAFRWQAGAGALKYSPSQKLGIFVADSPTRWLLAAGVSWSKSVGENLNLVVGGRYDFSTFTTKRLSSLGYSQFTTIQRGGFSAGVERSF